ncbi:MAG TPA: zinc ABC transporter solute-binding protein [Dehalococcoidia bacterium]|jgi:zinc transport system substrate-binding protein|nr:zinc ABC transporter solute-binding protein [Dehalococcoidia bacterium]
MVRGPALKRFLPLLVVMVAASILSCGGKEETGGKIEVVVTIPPQAEFVERVGGERVMVTVMVPPGANLHTYEPTPSQMTALAGAEMYAKVGSGIEFELAWMDRLLAVNQDMLVVDCAWGVEIEEVAGKRTLDPHIWMSPRNAKIMVQNIYDGLVQVDPDGKEYYRQNLERYLRELSQLDQEIRDKLSGVTNRRFMVYHPAFGYFAREYNLVMLPIEAEGKEPTAAGLARLIEQAKENGIKVIFAEPQFNPQSAEVIAEAIDGRVVLIDPLAKDYVVNLRRLADEMALAMK